MFDEWIKSAIMLAIIASLTFILLYLFAVQFTENANLPALAGVACALTAIVSVFKKDWFFTALFLMLVFIFFGLPAIGLAILILYAIFYLLREYWGNDRACC